MQVPDKTRGISPMTVCSFESPGRPRFQAQEDGTSPLSANSPLSRE